MQQNWSLLRRNFIIDLSTGVKRKTKTHPSVGVGVSWGDSCATVLAVVLP